MAGEIESERLEVWRAFLEAHAAIISILEEKLEAEEGLDLTWYDVLVHLSEAEEQRLRMQELASAILLSKSGLSRLIDRMEQAGMVERVACKEDRRGTWAQLTGEGMDTLRRTAPTHADHVRQHFTSLLTDDEVAAMNSALQKVLAAGRDRVKGR